MTASHQLQMGLRWKRPLVLGVVTGILALGASIFSVTTNRSCASHDDAAARTAAVTAALQESAAQGRITTQELAARIARVNGAATELEKTRDTAAFCAALDGLDAEFKAAQ